MRLHLLNRPLGRRSLGLRGRRAGSLAPGRPCPLPGLRAGIVSREARERLLEPPGEATRGIHGSSRGGGGGGDRGVVPEINRMRFWEKAPGAKRGGGGSRGAIVVVGRMSVYGLGMKRGSTPTDIGPQRARSTTDLGCADVVGIRHARSHVGNIDSLSDLHTPWAALGLPWRMLCSSFSYLDLPHHSCYCSPGM